MIWWIDVDILLHTDDLIEEEVVIIVGIVSHALGLLQAGVSIYPCWILLRANDLLCVGPKP